jgi:hypothetical protein
MKVFHSLIFLLNKLIVTVYILCERLQEKELFSFVNINNTLFEQIMIMQEFAKKTFRDN